MLRLVQSRHKSKFYYVASRRDFDLLCSIKVPLKKIAEDMLPLLRQRCRKAKISIETRSFSEIEASKFKKIRKLWSTVSIEYRSGSFNISVPANKIKEVVRAFSLARALADFYERHMYNTQIVEGRKSKTCKVILNVEFNNEKVPGWKD